ncbi:hypothetical protein GUJ93_ZPchr0001g31636 [Zizania palustris]|uniref:Glucan endo-1,3-beta-D-glucosidase n=1 Tax=Zizania palustris TaxID=103762 RepID=A0A8J5RNJ1_ZIZPA|nr:hypothetical protein GUJ93_ZPchr0001g31636 [Zizania palustris]
MPTGDNLLPPLRIVVGMLRDNGFTTVRLYAPERDALTALGGTGIRVVVGAPNDVLGTLASGVAAAAAWVRDNIRLTRWSPSGTSSWATRSPAPIRSSSSVVPAMVHGVLAMAGLGHIKVTTSISHATIGVHFPPSAGEFTDEAKSLLSFVIPFLEETRAPFLAMFNENL